MTNHQYLKDKIVLCLFFCLLCCGIVSAQQTKKPYLLHWVESDGLSDNNINGLLKDKKGWLWIATLNGLSRFDGKEFETFRFEPKDFTSVGANEAMRLMESENGDIWVGTDGGGLSVFNAKKNNFITIRQDLEYPKKGLAENRIYSLLEEEDEVLVGYRAIGSGKGGLTSISKDLKIKEHLLQHVKDYAGFPMKVTRSYKDSRKEGVYWLGGRSFFRWDRKTGEVEEFPHPSFRPNLTSLTGINDYTDSTILVAIVYDGIWLFDTQKKEWLKRIHDKPTYDVKRSEDGKIWVSDVDGLGWLDPDNYEINYEIKTTGPASPFDKKIKINHFYFIDENIWMATDNGLYCWVYSFQQFNTDRLTVEDKQYSYFPESIGESRQKDWLFLDRKRGLIFTDSLFNTKKIVSTPKKKSFRKATFYKNEEKSFAVLGANKGIYIWEEGDHQLQPLVVQDSSDLLKGIQAWSIYTDDQEDVWIGTRISGLIKVDLENKKLTQFLHDSEDSLSLCHDKYLFEIDKDSKNNLWVCTDKGVSIIDPVKEEFVFYPGLEEIQNYVIHAVELDDRQNMWIGSRDQGLFKYHIPSATLVNFTVIDGLFYNGVGEITREDSILWLSTRKGLCRLNLNTEEIIGFDQKKGLYTNALYNSRLTKLPDESIMMTYQSSNYFSVFRNEWLKTHFPPPDLVINKLRILTQQESKPIYTSSGSNIYLEPHENYFAIDFKAIHFFQPRGLEYKYRLKGYDNDWIEVGDNNTAVYTNLPGGDYQFEVKAANSDARWSNTQQLNIFLATPWYETTLFYLLTGLFIAGLIYAFYKNRTNQIRKEENLKRQLAETEMKALRSQINPHFIFNCLNSIKGYIIENRIEDGTEYVGRFAQLIRMILNHSKEKLIPISREIEAIKHYVWLEQERLNHKFNVSFSLSFKNNADDFKIPPLLFQPYIENAIWHGLMSLERNGDLEIKIEELSSHLLIQILDDGIGRKKSLEIKNESIFKKPSMGLEISAGRLEQINELYKLKSEITIEDQYPGRLEPGTKVSITFPKIKTNIYAQSNVS